jgi:hypothetical protein
MELEPNGKIHVFSPFLLAMHSLLNTKRANVLVHDLKLNILTLGQNNKNILSPSQSGKIILTLNQNKF